MRFFRNVFFCCLVTTALAAGAEAASLCGDVNINGQVTTSDALLVLRKAVAQNLQLQCPDFINRYGDPEDVHKSSLFDKDHLLGWKVAIERASTVTHLGLIAREGGTKVRMALYSDDNGSPGELIVATPETTVLIGSQEIAVADKVVAPGDYWVMAVFDQVTLVAADENAPPGPMVNYRTLTFGTPLPETFGPAFSYGETLINYWLKVRQ
jgi:hypothetical protein